MSIARDISRQTSRQTVTLTANQTAVTVTGGFSSSTVEVYLNGAKLIQGSDYSLNGTSGITLTQGASAGDIIEFSIRNSSNSGLSAVNTNEVVDGAVTFDKLSDSSTTADNVQQRVAKAWVNFDGTFATSPFTEANGGIRDSFNVVSVTDIGTGHYDVNFEDSFANANYAWAGSAGDTNTTLSNITPTSVRTGQMTTDKIRIIVNYSYMGSTVLHDYEMVSLIIFGE